MILSVGSSLASFKTLRFDPGLNVIQSTRAEGSKEGMTRNSAGKTSFVELVHFLLGADCDRDDLFRKKALIEHSFNGTFSIYGSEVRVERRGANPSRILMDPDVAERLGLATKPDKDTKAPSISATDWNEFLGHAMFGLPANLKGSPYGESYTPGFRPLFSYFARRDGSGGFVSPERQAERQQRWDWQVNLSYLFGLDWRISRELHAVRQRETMLKELKKAAKGGALGTVIGTSSDLRSQVVYATKKASQLRDRLERFEVVESYRELSAEAAMAKTELQAIARRAVSLKETVAHLKAAFEGEESASVIDVQRLYQAVGVELPGAHIKRRFEQVVAFQQSVVSNRRAHLAGEIARAEEEIADGEARSVEFERERTRILGILQSGGALDDFIDMQKLLTEADAEVAALNERLKAAWALEQETTQLDIDRGNIKLRLAANLRSEENVITESILLIGQAISTLYDDRGGSFEVTATENGPEFRISIPGDRGGGISLMEIFCLDYALFTIWQARRQGPGFLLHDSRLFDGVDPRQTLAAIRLGKLAAEQHGGQYIVCLNSDTLEVLAPTSDIDWASATVNPVLTDRDDGGLFGFRFD